MSIQFRVNEQPVSCELREGEARRTLMDYLRNTLCLTGTKCGCEERGCGACTVLVDGVAKKSCSVFLENLSGVQVLTVEGLEVDGKLDPLQEAFLEYNAVQCGFCTPGILMSAKGLLHDNPDPTEADIKKALRLNLCRCGTYPRVILAVQKAAAVMRGDEAPAYHPQDFSQEGSFIGRSMPRRDLPDKVTGKTKFYADYRFDDMLYGKAVYAQYPHANILSIDVTAASDSEGVQVVLTAQSVPGVNRYGVLCPDQPVFCYSRVRHIGETVAVVFADSKEAAEAGASKVEVVYDELPGVFSVEEALKPDAILIPDPGNTPHPMAYIAGEKGNVCKEVHLRRGNREEAFARCSTVVQGAYRTKTEEHAWIETDGTLSEIDENGNVAVYAPNQSPFADRDQLAAVLGLPPDRVRIKHMPAGGAFGGKTELTTHVPCALATLKTGRPASMVLSRKDSLRTHPKRHPYDMEYRIGADADGKILAMDAYITSDTGAYASWTPRVLEQGISYSTGPYYVPNFELCCQGVYTNNMVKGAMRGFGAAQTHFAVECLMDELAEKLGMDPLELRRINALDRDLPMATGQYPNTQGIDYKNTLKIASSLVEDLEALVEQERTRGNLVGIGVASGWRSVAGGLGPDENAGARFALTPMGRVVFGIACTEMGQGSHTSLAQMAAEVTGVDWDDFDIVAGDTSVVPPGGGVMASRGVYLWGHPTIKAGKAFRASLAQAAAQVLGLDSGELAVRESRIVSALDGRVLMTLAELAQEVAEPIEVQVDFQLPKTNPVAENANEDAAIPASEYNPHQTVSYNTTVAAVRIDPRKGGVDVLYLGAVIDGGRIVNPDAAATQIEGALIMGAGYGLSSDFKIEKGVNVANSLGKCKIPRFDTMPAKLDVRFTDATDQTGPFGSKGIAEVAVLTPAPAICNAVYDAVGVRLHELPVSAYAAQIREAAQRKLAEA